MTVCPSARARRLPTRGALAVGVATALLAAGTLPQPVAAEHWSPPTTVYVERTGHTADRLFLDLWREQPRLLGDPITEEFETRSGFANRGDGGLRAQFFENLAIAYDPDAPVGEQVVPLDLGAQALADRLADRPSATLLRADRRTVCGSGAECVGFAASGHTLRGSFLEWWTDHEGDRWLGAPLTEPFRAPDGSLVQYFEFGALRKRAGGNVAPLPLGRIVARQQGIDTDPVARPDAVPVYSPALFVEPPVSEDDLAASAPAAPALPADWVTPAIQVGWITGSFGPGPQQGGYKEIVISISQQAAWAYEGGDLMMSSMVSTGTAEIPETVTPVGFHSVLSKYDVQTMEGFIGGEDYKVENVPDILYFDNLGNAIHGAYWHSNFGTPMSHGCVNLPLDAAAWLFSWAEVGTPVTVVP